MKNSDRITPKIETEPVTTKKKVGFYIAYAAIAIIALVVGIFLYWSFQPDKVLQVNNSPFPVRTIREHPTADGVVILKVDLCKHSGTVGQVRTSFVSESREIFLPLGKEQLPKGCLKQEVPVLIPTDTPEGKYKIKFSVTYQINPIKRSVEVFETREFVVDPK